MIISDAMNSNKSMSMYSREQLLNREVLAIVKSKTGEWRYRYRQLASGGEKGGDAKWTTEEPTCSGQRVLQGSTWQVQGTNGSNAAQPDHPWGSTLTFQRKVGASRVQRRGVTMHPMGATFEGRHDLVAAWNVHSYGS